MQAKWQENRFNYFFGFMYVYGVLSGLQGETYKSSQRSSSSRMLAKSPSKFEKAHCLKSPACGPFIRSILPPDLR